ALAIDGDAARDGKLRLAVVIAGVVDAWALARKAFLTLEQDGLHGREAKLELEIARDDRRDVAVSGEPERPIVDPYRGSVLRRAGILRPQQAHPSRGARSGSRETAASSRGSSRASADDHQSSFTARMARWPIA